MPSDSKSICEADDRCDELFRGFAPTRLELRFALRYWYQVFRTTDFANFQFQQCRPVDGCTINYACGRIGLIGDAIGNDDVGEIVASVDAELIEELGEDYRIFACGTAEEYQQLKTEVQREMEKAHSAPPKPPEG